MTPTPGEPFEAHGLTWRPDRSGVYWSARLGGSAFTLSNCLGVWAGNGRECGTFDAAIAWAIRTCPGARCGSCAHRNAYSKCTALEAQYYSPEVPEDGFCHRWTK
jgi:hypothetical protein